MALVGTVELLAKLAPSVDAALAKQLVNEFVSLERRFILRDWEPAELDAGQFSEVLSRILLHFDSRTLSPSKKFDDCLTYIEDKEGRNAHMIQPRQDALTMARVMRTVYAFRSNRGPVHISPNYTANHMDSKFMMEGCRWLMNELLRISLKTEREAAAKMISEILLFDVPCVGEFGKVIMVQRTDVTPQEELLILLHYAGDSGFSRKELGNYAKLPPYTVTKTLAELTSQDRREIVQLSEGNYRLSDLGAKRVREQLGPKLVLQ